MAHFERKLGGQELFRGHILRVELDTVELEDGSTSRREVVRHPGGAAVLPLDGENRVCLVRQFRYAFGQELLEIPAGKLEPGEDPEEAALRELREECGLEAGRVDVLGPIYPSVGYDDEIIYLYLARELRSVEARPDEGEFLTQEEWPLETLVQMACAGELRDAKTVAAVLKTAWLLR